MVGAPEGIRTPNLLIRSQMLYPLSYGRSENGQCNGPYGLAPKTIERRRSSTSHYLVDMVPGCHFSYISGLCLASA